ncbi:beta-propeller fold lactonase family protein [Microbacterium sp. BWT-B31]|uniref:lactonase family protein n=1 Tax=Microbacterium sp. BWT-B31 TaxID=3232072 RepID=UPI0035286E75
MRLLLGGYTADMDGAAQGLGVLRAGDADGGSAGGPLAYVGPVAAADSPSWVTKHPTLDVFYATLEHTGVVQAFRRTGEESFAAFGGPVEAGAATCHAVVAPDGRALVASCWGDGRVVHLRVDAAGRLSAPQLGAEAADPYAPGAAAFSWAQAQTSTRTDPDVEDALAAAARSLKAAAGDEFARFVPEYDAPALDVAGAVVLDGAGAGTDAAAAAPERVSRAHSALFLPDGRVVTADLGYDLVRFWRRSAERLVLDHEVVLPLGSGPRHLVLHPSGHLHVVTEYSCEVFTLEEGPDARWRLVGGIPTGALAGDSAAELARSRDGQFLYAGLRGSNTIAVLRVRGAGEHTERVALVDAGVDWPRHHVVVRDTLLVAGQLSNEVASLTLDIRTGVPGRVRHLAEVPSPTCLLPLR